MTGNIVYNMDLPDESKYTNKSINGVGATCATIVNDKIRNDNNSSSRVRNERVLDTNNTGAPLSTYVQDAEFTYSVVNKIKLRDTENNIDHAKQIVVEDSIDIYAAVSG